MVDARIALVGAAGVLFSVVLISVALYFQSIGMYPPSDQPGLALYYEGFGLTGLSFGIVLVLGLASRSG